MDFQKSNATMAIELSYLLLIIQIHTKCRQIANTVYGQFSNYPYLPPVPAIYSQLCLEAEERKKAAEAEKENNIVENGHDW